MKHTSNSALCVLTVSVVAALATTTPAVARDEAGGGAETITVTSRLAGGTFPRTTSNLFDSRGRQVGFSTTNCETVAAPATNSCWGSYVFTGRGQITWQNATRDVSTPPYLTAITGGTGEFCDARGQIDVLRTSSDPGGGLSALKIIKNRDCPVNP